MELAMDVSETFVGNVGVDLGAGNTSMTQKFLDCP